jgi:hypothetical protein
MKSMFTVTKRLDVMKLAGRQVAVLIVLVACMVTPALAGTKYLDGRPDLTAYTAGINEYRAGDDIQIAVVIENNGMSLDKQVSSSVIDRDDPPSTAKFVTVTMSAGDAPLVIKSDPQMIGDLTSQTRKTVTIHAKVNQDAPAGTYSVPLDINYTRFDSVDQFQTDTFRYYYVKDHVAVTVPVVIKSEVIPEVLSATSDHLVAGADGYLNLTIKNIGSLDGAKATVKITRNFNSPITPVDSSVFVGDFPANNTVSCQYKVMVDKTAENKAYPVDVAVIYQNTEGDFVTSRTETVGVNVGNKVDFVILSPVAEMSPGSTKTIPVEYKNIGNSTIKSAQARISAVDPFTGISDTAYLGDLAPGQSVGASFEISVAGDATIKEYGLDSEIRYNDALNDTYISDPVKVRVNVHSTSIIIPVIIGLVIVAALIVAAVFYRRKTALR